MGRATDDGIEGIHASKTGLVIDRPTPHALRSFAGVVTAVALVVAGCGEAAPALPSATAGPTATPVAGLGATCAAQWVASISTYSDSSARSIPVVLMPSQGSEGPTIEPTSATLQTDQGPLALTVAIPWSDEVDRLGGTTRLELGLPVLEPGTYRAEFLDLVDASGTWRFRVGEYVINVLAGAAAGDLEQLGGTAQTGGLDGGSEQAFEIRVRNATDQRIKVTGVTTDIPGVPVTWVLIEHEPIRAVDHVAIPADGKATITVGADGTQQSVAFVLATPEMTYRVGKSAERDAMFDPVEFQSGFGLPSDMTVYRANLPADACAQQR
jgi:hypothetical protein